MDCTAYIWSVDSLSFVPICHCFSVTHESHRSNKLEQLLNDKSLLACMYNTVSTCNRKNELI